MDHNANPGGETPQLRTVREAAAQLDHPLAVLTGQPVTTSTTVETRRSNTTADGMLDAVLVVYNGASPIVLSTERKHAQQISAGGAAQQALLHNLLNTSVDAGDGTQESLIITTSRAVADLTPSAGPTIVVDGLEYEPTEVRLHDHAAYAFETDEVRVTVAGPHLALAESQLEWWPISENA